MTWLLIYILTLSLYDLRTRRIPNWATFPLIVAGLIAHFPGYLDTWLACLGLVLAWANGWMGAGDAKLWIALLWALPVDVSTQALPLIFLTFFLTGLLQLTWRWMRRQTILNLPTPGAWRTIPFLLLIWHVH